MDTSGTNLKVALIMGAVTLAVAFVLYSVFTGYVNKPDPAALQAEALLVEAQAKEYEGESSLVQAKANLVSAYPGTITAAGETAMQIGLGLFLALLGVGIAWLIFSIGTSFIVRSTANAYRDVSAVRVLPQLQNGDDPKRFITPGVAGNGGIYSEDLDATPGGADAAKQRYLDKSGSTPDPASSRASSKAKKGK